MTNGDLTKLRQTFHDIRGFFVDAPEKGFLLRDGEKLDELCFMMGGFDCILKMGVDSWEVRMVGEGSKKLVKEGYAALTEERLNRIIDDFIEDCKALGYVVEDQAA
ncbi:MAG: hypothetical protein ACKVOE_05760 [Rickettsiales bacterium]